LLALLALPLLALALAACSSAPPTVGVVDAGARPRTLACVGETMGGSLVSLALWRGWD